LKLSHVKSAQAEPEFNSGAGDAYI
jgi:hypothetical protein